MTPRPKNKTVKRTVSKDHQLIKRHTWTAPDALDADGMLDGQLVTAVSLTFTTFIAQPDFARTLSLIPKTNTTDVPAGDVTINGTDINDEVISDVLTFAANASTAQNTVKAFKTVTSIVFPTPDGDTATWDLGTLDALGLSERIQEDSILHTLVDGTVESTRPTVVSSTVNKNLCTIDCDTALNGSKDVVCYYTYPFPTV